MLKETGTRQIHKSGQQACHPADEEDIDKELPLPLKKERKKKTCKVIISFIFFTCSH